VFSLYSPPPCTRPPPPFIAAPVGVGGEGGPLAAGLAAASAGGRPYSSRISCALEMCPRRRVKKSLPCLLSYLSFFLWRKGRKGRKGSRRREGEREGEREEVGRRQEGGRKEVERRKVALCLKKNQKEKDLTVHDDGDGLDEERRAVVAVVRGGGGGGEGHRRERGPGGSGTTTRSRIRKQHLLKPRGYHTSVPRVECLSHQTMYKRGALQASAMGLN
jgi:hypothetical protein